MTDRERLLFVRHDPAPGDLALVFGSADLEESARRARAAARLHAQGFVPRLLLSGGNPGRPGEPSEAAWMAQVTRAAGVPDESTLLEEQSRTTFENVERCLELLDRLGLRQGLRTVLLVSAPWHMGRALRTCKRYVPDGVTFLCCPHDEPVPDLERRALAEYDFFRSLIEAGALPSTDSEC